jgi:hypothetical protein
MSKDTADIVGSKGAQFTIILVPEESTGTTGVIKKAILKKSGQPDQELPFEEHEVTLQGLNKLPGGDSLIVLNILWGPGDSDALIVVGQVTSGDAHSAEPTHYIQVDDVPGYIQLFGE